MQITSPLKLIMISLRKNCPNGVKLTMQTNQPSVRELDYEMSGGIVTSMAMKGIAILFIAQVVVALFNQF